MTTNPTATFVDLGAVMKQPIQPLPNPAKPEPNRLYDDAPRSLTVAARQDSSKLGFSATTS